MPSLRDLLPGAEQRRRPGGRRRCGRCFWGRGARLVSHPVSGQPAVLAFIRRELAGVLVFTMRGELIQAVHVIGDPRKLDFLSSQLTTLA